MLSIVATAECTVRTEIYQFYPECFRIRRPQVEAEVAHARSVDLIRYGFNPDEAQIRVLLHVITRDVHIFESSRRPICSPGIYWHVGVGLTE